MLAISFLPLALLANPNRSSCIISSARLHASDRHMNNSSIRTAKYLLVEMGPNLLTKGIPVVPVG